MTGGAFINPCVLEEKDRPFYGTSLHRVLTATAEHLAAQGISDDVPLNALGPVTLGLYLRKYLPTDNANQGLKSSRDKAAARRPKI